MLGLAPDLGRGPLFGELLPRLIGEQEVDAHYVPSTPSGGELPFRPSAGVAHYFGVGAYRRPLDDARRAEVKFAAECLAIANVPGDGAIEELAPSGSARLVHHPAWKAGVPRDVGAGWDFEDVRDHYLRELYGIDPVDLRWADPDRYLALSRVVSGEVMAATFGEWRRARSACAGALVWTLNDPLPGAGWGVFDSAGRPKAAYWYLKRALAPVAVWMTDEGTNGISVHVANDRGVSLSARLEIALHRRDGTAVDTAASDLELGPHTTSELSVEGLLGHFADAGYAYRFGPAPHELVVATLSTTGALRSQAFHYPLGLPAHVQPAADIGLATKATPAGERRVRPRADQSTPRVCRRSRRPRLRPERRLLHRRAKRFEDDQARAGRRSRSSLAEPRSRDRCTGRARSGSNWRAPAKARRSLATGVGTTQPVSSIA